LEVEAPNSLYQCFLKNQTKDELLLMLMYDEDSGERAKCRSTMPQADLELLTLPPRLPTHLGQGKGGPSWRTTEKERGDQVHHYHGEARERMRTDVWPGNLNLNFARIPWNETLNGMTGCRNQVSQLTTEMTPNDYLNIKRHK
jgi:hypothetical protein